MIFPSENVCGSLYPRICVSHAFLQFSLQWKCKSLFAPAPPPVSSRCVAVIDHQKHRRLWQQTSGVTGKWSQHTAKRVRNCLPGTSSNWLKLHGFEQSSFICMVLISHLDLSSFAMLRIGDGPGVITDHRLPPSSMSTQHNKQPSEEGERRPWQSNAFFLSAKKFHRFVIRTGNSNIGNNNFFGLVWKCLNCILWRSFAQNTLSGTQNSEFYTNSTVLEQFLDRSKG